MSASKEPPDLGGAHGHLIVATTKLLLAMLVVSVPTEDLWSVQGQRPYAGDRLSLTRRSATGAASEPNWMVRYHDLGNLRLVVSNTGDVGEVYGTDCEGNYVSGFEFPMGSRSWLGGGGDLWIGGVREGDTLVSTGWAFYAAVELWPAAGPGGAIRERTTRSVLSHGGSCPSVTPSDSAISEQDLIAIYSDTLTDPAYTEGDPYDGRPHIPLGIEITQTSYAWSFAYAQDFVIVEYEIRNIGVPTPGGGVKRAPLHELYVGILGHSGALHFDGPFLDSSGEMSDGYVGMATSEPMPRRPELLSPVAEVWCADNDGEPVNGAYVESSITSCGGLRVLRLPEEDDGIAFNWWAYTFDENPARDWGPVRRSSQVEFVHGGLGTPWTDRARYQMMSNAEIDYPQLEAAIDHEASGWLPPVSDRAYAQDVAGGHRAYWLLSAGPFDLADGESRTFAVAMVGGEGFHRNPYSFQQYFDPYAPAVYASKLDLSDFQRNAQQAAFVYDVPGLDSDGDGFAGRYNLEGTDTVFYSGDGVPDFKGPPPPTPPILRYEVDLGTITLKWNGMRSETEVDPFSRRIDFEGYRVYLGRTGRLDDFALVTQRDLTNFARYTLNPSTERWELRDPPFSEDSLHVLYDSLCLVQYGHAFEVDSFSVKDVDQALLETHLDPHAGRLDSLFRTFSPFDANARLDDVGLARAAALGIHVSRVIRKTHPEAQATDSLTDRNGKYFRPYYEYEYVLAGLQVAEPVFLAVTTFDHGDPATGLASQESSPLATSTEIWPVSSAAEVKALDRKPGVYPNPYRLADNYNSTGWENSRGSEPDAERARQVTFYNVPDTCTLSVWSLDGDLVRRIDHRSDPYSSEATVVRWNLITKNTQAVKTGIYIWSVESRFGTDVGKLVIVK